MILYRIFILYQTVLLTDDEDVAINYMYLYLYLYFVFKQIEEGLTLVS
jgi:hypothetical protein